MAIVNFGYSYTAGRSIHAVPISRITLILAVSSLWFAFSTSATVLPRTPSPPKALSEFATKDDLKWQPVLDYDKDSCYNVAVIDKDGNIAKGLSTDGTTNTDHCRDKSDMDNSNTYSRQRCNSGWCVYVYDYYFEKDVALQHVKFGSGHQHDWEHVVVWVKNDEAKFVSASGHGDYDIQPASAVRWQGNHPKIVYHKSGPSTHAFRFAKKEDDKIENEKGVWWRSPLVSWLGLSEKNRKLMTDREYGKANFALKDSSFPGTIEKAIPKKYGNKNDFLHTIFGPDTPKENLLFKFNFKSDKGSPGKPHHSITHEQEEAIKKALKKIQPPKV